MLKTSPIWDAVTYREELNKLPEGFSAKEAENSKKWCIYFKFSPTSKALKIRIGLTMKQAERIATTLNLILSSK